MKKKTLKELKAEREVELHNSNMQNLATASDLIDAQLFWMKTEADRLRLVGAEIDQLSKKDITDTSAVTKLFKEAKIGDFVRKDW